MLVCLLFIGSIAAVGYVSLLLPDKLVLTRSLLIIAGGVTAAAGLILCAVSGRGEGRAALIFFRRGDSGRLCNRFAVFRRLSE